MKNKCYLCGCAEYRNRSGKVRDDASLEILECHNCGLVYLSRTEVPQGFYEQSRMHGAEPLLVDASLRDTERDDERRFRYLCEAMTNCDVLDFGCGMGGFLLKARQSARSVTGIELEARLYAHYQANQLKVVRDTDAIPPEQYYDLITAFHVVEHLEDPAETLRRLAGRLRVGGQLVVEVPSSADALLTLYNSVPFSEFTYWSCHLYLFNAANLPLLAKKAGLKLDYVSHIQRYPLSNHLYWLAKGKPGGHKVWSHIDDAELSRSYEARLAALGLTDTLIAGFGLPCVS